MPTDEEIREAIEYWGDDLPNPDHEPIQCKYKILWYLNFIRPRLRKNVQPVD